MIHENGAMHKDNRLKVFDKIVEIDGKKISSETSDHEMNKIFQSLYARVCTMMRWMNGNGLAARIFMQQVKMTVYRAEPPDLKEMDVEITKKSGKDIGLSFAECKDNGIYVLDIVRNACASNTSAAVDAIRLLRLDCDCSCQGARSTRTSV